MAVTGKSNCPSDLGTDTSSDHRSALKIARWWHCQHDTSSDRTPLARMLPSVIGSIGSLKRLKSTKLRPPQLDYTADVIL
jgi:hypothetical protein